jgi:hypothetical protein
MKRMRNPFRIFRSGVISDYRGTGYSDAPIPWDVFYHRPWLTAFSPATERFRKKPRKDPIV